MHNNAELKFSTTSWKMNDAFVINVIKLSCYPFGSPFFWKKGIYKPL
jgi:hypothetical protein